MGFPGGSAVKNLPTNAGDMDSVPELRRSPREENGNPLQYFCLRNPIDRGALYRILQYRMQLYKMQTKSPV